ncbi:MAG: hypothetical protein AB7U73_23625 [Pirellulales bacterium]
MLKRDRRPEAASQPNRTTNGSLRKSSHALMVGTALCLAACGGDSNDGRETVLAEADVNAAAGGSVAVPGNALTVTIPPGALSADSKVSIVQVRGDLPALSGPLQAAGDAYAIRVGTGVTLSQAVRVEIAANAAPTHPQLAEMAELVDGKWQRASANFFRARDSKVVALTKGATTVRPVFRRLQAATGDEVARGRDVFLYETFGNENFFGNVVGLHTLLNSLTPTQAVGAGVQIDLARVPSAVAGVLTGTDLAAKDAALQDPAVTRALLKADAVVGVKAVYADPASDMATSAGITCALCHVNAAPTTFQLSSGPTPLPIGALRLDGTANTSMDAGAILSLTPFAQGAGSATVTTLQSWGPGRFDVRALPDNPLEDNVNNPTKVPPLWNFPDLREQGYAYNWDGLFKNGEAGNALASQAEAVYDLVMHANGAFGTPGGSIPPELSITPPPALLSALGDAETAAPGNDITAQKLLDVQAWQRSHVSPAPGPYDEALAEQGFLLFNGKAGCAGCHRTAEFTGPVVTNRITVQPPQGGLAAGIKTPGLRGVSKTGAYFHDGSAKTLNEVVDVYAGRITPALTDSEKTAVVEYLKSL